MSVCVRFLVPAAGALLLAALLSSCGSSESVQNLGAEERFRQAKEKFAREDYLEAINDFQIIKLQFPGSSYADSSQYFLGECHFRQEEYLLAIAEFQVLQRNFRSSALVPDAMFRIGMSYYDLSPKPSLDQSYTKKAIESFQSFIDLYPANPQVPQAEEKIRELNDKLAQKLYDSGRLYMKMEYYKSAITYFDAVLDKYHDTPYAEPSQLEKTRALIARRKYTEARQEIDKFLEKYPNSRSKDDANALKRQIEDAIGHPASSASPGIQ